MTKPVLLFVHGGPGMPEYFLDRTHPTGLEQDFVVAWWEQRGAGMSYSAGRDDTTMTIDQMVDDVIGVADYLRTRFHQDRIYLMAQSGAASSAYRRQPGHPTASWHMWAWVRSRSNVTPRNWPMSAQWRPTPNWVATRRWSDCGLWSVAAGGPLPKEWMEMCQDRRGLGPCSRAGEH